MTTTTDRTPDDDAREGPGPVWAKPGPGSWRLDTSHFEPDCARLSQRAIEIGMAEGMRQGFEVMGAPLRGMEAAFVNGSFYHRLVPLVGGNLDLPLPPAPVLWLVARLHPAFRRQTRRARRAIEGRVWNDELARWVDEDRPWLVERCTALSAVHPSELDDGGLSRHLQELIELVNRGTTLHFRLHVSDLGPIGLLLVRARDWGLDGTEVMATLSGSSPETSAPRRALAAIGRSAGADGATGPFASFDDVRSASPEAGRMLDRFLDRYGWRLTTGYDLQDLALVELPELVLTAIDRAAADPDGIEREADGAAVTDAGRRAFEALADRLSTDDAAEFERLVADARALYGLRDENGPLTYQWPAGLLRRALLETAKRLADRGLLSDVAQVFDLEGDELAALLTGGTGPAVAELEDRRAQRREWARHRAPAVLGPEMGQPPLWALPGPLARAMDVVVTVLDLIESDGSGPATLDGIGIGDRPAVGRARIVTDAVDALARMEPGDVLVAPFTVPTYNAALATAGAVVVENGGLLCHAAVIARECGIPGLVGVTGATGLLTDGALVRVDPVAGTIREIPA